MLEQVPDADLTRPGQGFVSPEPVESAFDYGYDAVMRGYEASRARLRRDRIDILYAHDLGRMTHGEAHPHHFRSEEHTSELQSLMRISYAVFCLKKKNKTNRN